MALNEVIAINHTTKRYTDKHHGISYHFNPNEKVQMPLAAAVHIFGLGLADKKPAWTRWGFRNSKDGEDFLKKFELKVVELVPAEVSEETSPAEPEEVEDKKKKK